MYLKEPNSHEVYELMTGLFQVSQFSGYGDGRSLDYRFLQQLAPGRRTGRITRRYMTFLLQN